MLRGALHVMTEAHRGGDKRSIEAEAFVSSPSASSRVYVSTMARKWQVQTECALTYAYTHTHTHLSGIEIRRLEPMTLSLRKPAMAYLCERSERHKAAGGGGGGGGRGGGGTVALMTETARTHQRGK